jgi:hypothetical protein
MRQTKAKAIRKKVYGDYAQRDTGYFLIKRLVKKLVRDKETDKDKLVTVATGQVICVGRRAEYQKAKAAYLRRTA